MKLEYNIEWLATFVALMVLRQIRDWNPDENISAFTGLAGEQFNGLFCRFKEIIISSGLFDPADPSSLQREMWVKALDLLEAKLGPMANHPGVGGNKDIDH